MVWIHKEDAWKLMVPKKHKLISYREDEPQENKDDWVKIDKIPEGARKLGADE